MGKDIKKTHYNDSDLKRFEVALVEQLTQLKSIIAQPKFGQATMQLGAELEMYLVDDNGNVSLSNQLLLEQLNDEQFQPELNQYNLELNLLPIKQHGNSFSQLQQQLQQKTGELERLASQHGINIIPIGILPTLSKANLNSEHMTNLARYHALSNQLYQQRGKAFEVNINGEEPVSVNFNDICAEGANTSFQVHLMVKPELFSKVFNAAQLTLPLVTAISANSPIFLGNRVWDETRIALFKQSLDIRSRDPMKWQQPTRVNFGFGWLQGSPWDLFAQAVSLYPPLLPEIKTHKTTENIPPLHELNLHMGTIWPWNRPVFCNHENGHIRLEFRAIPAGPTSIDMVANAAFAIGLSLGLTDDIDLYTAIMPFRFAEYNFYRAAQHGLDARVLWPSKTRYKVEEQPITQIIAWALPIAKKGLASIGVSASDIDKYLSVIEQRLSESITGAIWQKQSLIAMEKTQNKQLACQQLVNTYIQQCRTCLPVGQWEQPWL